MRGGSLSFCKQNGFANDFNMLLWYPISYATVKNLSSNSVTFASSTCCWFPAFVHGPVAALVALASNKKAKINFKEFDMSQTCFTLKFGNNCGKLLRQSTTGRSPRRTSARELVFRVSLLIRLARNTEIHWWISEGCRLKFIGINLIWWARELQQFVFCSLPPSREQMSYSLLTQQYRAVW